MGFSMSSIRRLMCYSSGAMRGIYYAGVMRALDEEGITFDDFAGISVGSTAAAWHAAGQAREVLEAWDALGIARLSIHPFFNSEKSKNLDWLIHNVSLPHLNVEALKTSGHTLHVAVSELKARWRWNNGIFGRSFFHFQGDFRKDELFMAIRASCYMPFINGIFATITIAGKRYLDGGLTGRIPIDCTDLAPFDVVWLAVSSPSGLAELKAINLTRYPGMRFIAITPSRPVPIGRTEIDLTKFHDTATLGYDDTIRVIKGL